MSRRRSEVEREPNRRASLRLAQLVPNLLTLGALCAGLSAIRFAADGAPVLAVAMIALAAALDGLDGTMARLLKSESAIGAELDSLADFLNFGAAPAMVLYLWVLQDGPSGGWIAALIYAICCAMRLARFNVGDRSGAPKSPWFQGVPAPGGALLALLPMVLVQISPALPAAFVQPFTGIWLVVIGLLMISRITTPSVKLLRISRDKAPFALVAVMALITAGFTWPWSVLFCGQLAYIALLLRCVLRPFPVSPCHDDMTKRDSDSSNINK
ncbi:phosphatidylcholine/phosphatidylserine synthase [Alisedimentitalea sp. MJ-SS2]|nr:phosphatidylcholine/phosphatidylserine synthase [Alisedimentitalea sp. MJ-SS2]